MALAITKGNWQEKTFRSLALQRREIETSQLRSASKKMFSLGAATELRIIMVDERGEYLFDIPNDPLEMRDLAGAPEYQQTLNQMRERLLTHLRSAQVNFAAGSKSKVQRLREAEAQTDK